MVWKMLGTNHQKVEVRASIAGVFYRRPSPEDPPYVEAGDQVNNKQILCLMEAMKVSFKKLKRPWTAEWSRSLPKTRNPWPTITCCWFWKLIGNPGRDKVEVDQ
jgi:hypothetical protein